MNVGTCGASEPQEISISMSDLGEYPACGLFFGLFGLFSIFVCDLNIVSLYLGASLASESQESSIFIISRFNMSDSSEYNVYHFQHS